VEIHRKGDKFIGNKHTDTQVYIISTGYYINKSVSNSSGLVAKRDARSTSKPGNNPCSHDTRPEMPSFEKLKILMAMRASPKCSISASQDNFIYLLMATLSSTSRIINTNRQLSLSVLTAIFQVNLR